MKGKKVKSYIKNYYKYGHKKKAHHSGNYIAGAIACKIRREHGRTCNPRAKRKEQRHLF